MHVMPRQLGSAGTRRKTLPPTRACPIASPLPTMAGSTAAAAQGRRPPQAPACSATSAHATHRHKNMHRPVHVPVHRCCYKEVPHRTHLLMGHVALPGLLEAAQGRGRCVSGCPSPPSPPCTNLSLVNVQGLVGLPLPANELLVNCRVQRQGTCTKGAGPPPTDNSLLLTSGLCLPAACRHHPTPQCGATRGPAWLLPGFLPVAKVATRSSRAARLRAIGAAECMCVCGASLQLRE